MTVAATTGKMASNTIMVILETSNTPSHSITTGRKAIFGIGKPTEIIGSKNQRASALRDIAMPNTTPPTAAITKADHGAIERNGCIDREIAGDGIAPDALQHLAQCRQLERRDNAAARDQFPRRQQRDDEIDPRARPEWSAARAAFSGVPFGAS